MSHGLLLKKKEQHLQHQLLLQQQLHPFPSPITPTFEKKYVPSSCRYDVSPGGNYNGSEVSSTSSTSSSTSGRHPVNFPLATQFPFDYGNTYNSPFFNSYSGSPSLSVSHAQSLPSPNKEFNKDFLFPPTPPPSTPTPSTPFVHPSWFDF